MTADNRRDVVRIKPREGLNLCHYEGDWRPLALCQDGEVVGFAMRGLDNDKRRLTCGYW